MLVSPGCIWKRKTLPRSHSETNESSMRYSCHDDVQRAANSSHSHTPHFCASVV